jgi:hypothetical protein
MQNLNRSEISTAAAGRMARASEDDKCDCAIARAQCVGGDRTAATHLADARIAASGTIDNVAARLRRLGGTAEPGQG